MHVLRAEKGYIVVGQDTDGTVVPDDVGLHWMIGAAKHDFVGKRSLTRSDLRRRDRRQLVGLATVEPDVVLDEGAQITLDPMPSTGTPAPGFVTSAYYSPTLDGSIALALVAGGRTRMGTRLHVVLPAGSIAADVVSPVFCDPHGARLHG